MSDSGLFGPHSVTWRVNRESVLLLGGGRALLLQVAHPSVAAGVAQHSNYREDPWGRLARTLDVTRRIVFGDSETADEAARRLRGVHVRVQGTVEDGEHAGERYAAVDRELLLWVWATLVESSLLVYARYVGPLNVADAEAYYEEQKRFLAACGAPPAIAPETFAQFMAWYDAMVEDVLEVTPAARDVSRSPMFEIAVVSTTLAASTCAIALPTSTRRCSPVAVVTTGASVATTPRICTFAVAV